MPLGFEEKITRCNGCGMLKKCWRRPGPGGEYYCADCPGGSKVLLIILPLCFVFVAAGCFILVKYFPNLLDKLANYFGPVPK